MKNNLFHTIFLGTKEKEFLTLVYAILISVFVFYFLVRHCFILLIS